MLKFIMLFINCKFIILLKTEPKFLCGRWFGNFDFDQAIDYMKHDKTCLSPGSHLWLFGTLAPSLCTFLL